MMARKIKINTNTIILAIVAVVAIAMIAQFSGLFAVFQGIPVEFENVAGGNFDSGTASASYFLFFESFTVFPGQDELPYTGFKRINRNDFYAGSQGAPNDYQVGWFLGDRELTQLDGITFTKCSGATCQSPDIDVSGAIPIPNDIPDGTYTIEFKTRPTRIYYICLPPKTYDAGQNLCFSDGIIVPGYDSTFVSVDVPWETKGSITVTLQRGVDPPPAPAFCGNNVCEVDETTLSCPSDCSDQPFADCGNNVCENLETAENCPHDCIAEPNQLCGNGFIDTGENCVNCPEDFPLLECEPQEPVCETSSDCDTGFVCINGLCQEGVEPPPSPPVDLGLEPIHIALGLVLIALAAIVVFDIRIKI